MKKNDSLGNASYKTLRIGVVTTSFPLPPDSSSGIFVERLVAHMPSHVKVTVLTPDTGQPTHNTAPNKNYEITTFSYGPKKLERLTHRPGGIPDAIRRKDPIVMLLILLIPAMFIASFKLAGKVDLIHANWSAPGLIAALAARLRNKPVITTLRGEDANRAEKSPIFRFILRACLNLNDHCVVVSEALTFSMRKQFPHLSSKISFIPNGVSVSPSTNQKALSAPVRIITVANLIQRKKIHVLVNAVATFKKTAVSLRIVGDGPERTTLETLASSLPIRDQIEFVGNINPEKVEEHLHWADIFVLPSESEGRPNALLEAMAAGLPVIASDISGVRELLKDNAGLLFPVGDTVQLAEHLERLIANPDMAHKLGQQAKATIMSADLDWRRSAQCYVELYESLIQKKCAD